jgi:hypothetical protein
MDANKQSTRSDTYYEPKYLVIVAAMTVMLVGATALATTDSAFADGKKRYEKNQVAPIYNTGTGTAGDDTTTSADSPSSDGDTGGADEAESDNGDESGGTE